MNEWMNELVRASKMAPSADEYPQMKWITGYCISIAEGAIHSFILSLFKICFVYVSEEFKQVS